MNRAIFLFLYLRAEAEFIATGTSRLDFATRAACRSRTDFRSPFSNVDPGGSVLHSANMFFHSDVLDINCLDWNCFELNGPIERSLAWKERIERIDSRITV